MLKFDLSPDLLKDYINRLEKLYVAAVCMPCADQLAEEMHAIEQFQDIHLNGSYLARERT